MKKRFWSLLLVGMLFSIFMTGCEEDRTKEEETYVGTIERENLEYYYYSSGSSSVCEKFMIYQYDDQFIFAADYFDCGEGLLETYPLTEEQVERVVEEVNSVSPAEAFSAWEKSDEEMPDGGSRSYGILMVDGVSYKVGKIDFEGIGIEVKDAAEMEYPADLEDSFEIDGFKDLQESDQWKRKELSSGMLVFAGAVKEQAEAQTGAVMDGMAIGELGEEDLTVKLHTKEDEWYIATVTYRGFVADIVKE